MQEILIVDDDATLLSSMKELIEACLPVRCLAFSGYDQLVAQRDLALAPGVTLAVLDINLGYNRPNGIDVLSWLRREGFSGKCIFLTGHAKDHPVVREAARVTDAEIYEKPIDVNVLFNLIENRKHARDQAG